MQSAYVNVINLCQICTASVYFLSVFVQEGYAERLHGAHTAVIGGAAADGDGYVTDTGIQRMSDEHAGADTGCFGGVALVGGDERQAGGLGHLDDGLLTGQQAIACTHRVAQRPKHWNGLEGAAQRVYDRIHGAFAAVGDTQCARLGLREDLGRSLCQQRSDLL